jgi:hypothetical protein
MKSKTGVFDQVERIVLAGVVHYRWAEPASRFRLAVANLRAVLGKDVRALDIVKYEIPIVRGARSDYKRLVVGSKCRNCERERLVIVWSWINCSLRDYSP